MSHALRIGSFAIVLASFAAGSVQPTVQAQETNRTRYLDPVVFQAAGPSAASIQSMVDAFRLAIGGANNGNVAGPIATGRREINWDGGGSTATSVVPTPFDGFLLNRGARFATRGGGFVQAPVDGLAATFNNASYATEFKAFSPVRLFSPIDSNVTTAQFFVPGGGDVAATTKAFGAVFSDVDQQNDRWGHGGSTVLLFYGVYGNLLYRAGEQFALIDFGDAGAAPRIADLAIALAQLAIVGGRLRPEIWSGLWAGYAAIIDPTDDERAAVLPLVKLRYANLVVDHVWRELSGRHHPGHLALVALGIEGLHALASAPSTVLSLDAVPVRGAA